MVGNKHILLSSRYTSSCWINTNSTHQILFRWHIPGKWDGWNMWHVWSIREMHTRFWWEARKEIYYLEDLVVDGRIALW